MHVSREDSLRLLGSFARFVQEKSPELASQLKGLAMQWAVREDIPMQMLVDALKPPGDSG